MADPNSSVAYYQPPVLGFDQRWAPVLQLLRQQQQAGFNDRFAPALSLAQDPDDPRYIPGGDASNTPAQAHALLAAMMPQGDAPPQAAWTPGQAPQAALISGPQQSYANRSESAMPAGPGGGASGQALQQTSSYNNSPYSSGPQGTIGNTGAPLAQSGSQVVSQGGRGLDQYQSTPSWTGSPLSQSPPARDEGDFKAPPISGPQNPVQQRIAAMRQQLLARLQQNRPQPYHFKLG